jgi:hypothetical protein
MKNKFMEYCEAIGLYVRLTVTGWRDMLGSIFKFYKRQLEQETWQRHIFLASAVCLVIFAVPGWISYRISFLGEPFQGTVPSNSRFIFAISGFVCLVLYFLEMPAARTIALVTVSACAILYIAGFIFPVPLHTYLQNETDFQYTLWMYLSAIPMAGLFVTLREALQKPTIKASILKRFFKSGLSE